MKKIDDEMLNAWLNYKQDYSGDGNPDIFSFAAGWEAKKGGKVGAVQFSSMQKHSALRELTNPKGYTSGSCRMFTQWNDPDWCKSINPEFFCMKHSLLPSDKSVE